MLILSFIRHHYLGTINLVVLLRGGRDDKVNGFLAGLVAGFAILVESPSQRVGTGQQALVRGMQAWFNSLKLRGKFHFADADSILFA